MTLPGHIVEIGERVAAQRTPASTANGFMVGLTERGSAEEPILVRSLTEAISKLGDRINYGAIYDSLDVAFREGATAIYVGRIVGDDAAPATATLHGAVVVGSDNFNRANEGPPPGTPTLGPDWRLTPYVSDGDMKVVGDELAPDASGDTSVTWGEATTAPFRAELTCVTGFPASPGNDFFLQWHLAEDLDVSAGSRAGYDLNYEQGDFALYRVDGASSVLLATVSRPITAGDRVALQVAADRVQIWVKPDGDEWELLHDVEDTTYQDGTAVLNISSTKSDTSPRFDDFAIYDLSPSLRATATSPGAWGDDVDVIATPSGDNFTLTVNYQGATVETSPALADNAEAVAWAEANSAYVVLEDLSVGNDPADLGVSQSTSLAGGDDDHLAVTDDNFQAALDVLNKDLGPGQIAAPGFTTSAAYDALLAHAAATNRRALLDGADTADASALIAASTPLRGVPADAARFGAMFAPWAIVPGLSRGTTRTVPYSAVQMGLIARADAETGNSSKAAAGKRGKARYAIGLSQVYSDADRELLNDAGVDVAILIRGVVTTYGNRSLVNPLTDSDWRFFSASRTVMGVAALADLVLEDYDFETIDGKGHVFSALDGDLRGRACMPYYIADALYGQTPQEAFVVNTGPDVNTEETITAGEIHAQVGIRVSDAGEVLTTEIVKVSTGESL